MIAEADLPSVLILNGPNLNLLGSREPEVYGTETLNDLKVRANGCARRLGLAIEFRQTNRESELIDWIAGDGGRSAGLILNAAAFTHTSMALKDAIPAFAGPVIELHLSNNFGRERFRHRSFVSAGATGVIEGFGPAGYEVALFAMKTLLGD